MHEIRATIPANCVSEAALFAHTAGIKRERRQGSDADNVCANEALLRADNVSLL